MKKENTDQVSSRKNNFFSVVDCFLRFYFQDKKGKQKIPPRDVDTLISSLTSFCQKTIDKFIRGAIEHGGSLFDRDLEKEFEQEMVDMFVYRSFEKEKRKTLKK